MADLRWIRFESTALGGLTCEVKSLEGEDELNRLFWYTARIVVPAHAGAPGLGLDLLEKPAALVFEESGCEVARVHGVAAEVRRTADAERDAAIFAVTLVPRAWALTRTHRSELFLDRSVPQILAERLSGAGFEEGRDFVLATRERYPARELVAQYGERDWDFLSRLCEDQGIAFFFQHRDGRDVLVLTDTPHAFEPIPRSPPELRLGSHREPRAAFEVTRTLRRVPGQALVHDYNHRAPRLGVIAATSTGRGAAVGAWIEHGVHAKTPENAARLSRVRAEELAAAHDEISGKSTEMTLRAGATAVLVDDSGDEHPLLLTKVVHRSCLPGEASLGGTRTLHNEFTAIPAGVPYRPPRKTPRPKIPGLVHAVVDGAMNGPHAELDPAGRYKVRFRYDLSGRGDLQASRPVRMLQPHAGARYGLHFPLRPGTEVLIGFVEGDPDRPVIVGAVPNAETPSPVEQVNQTQNVLRTVAGNELVIEDAAGSERVRIHSPREDTTLQLGARDEPEEGALLKTKAHLTLVGGRSVDTLADRGTTLMSTSTTLVASNAVSLVGFPGIEASSNKCMSDFRRLSGELCPRVLEDLSELTPVPEEPSCDEAAGPASGARSVLHASTFSGLGEGLSARAHEVAAGSVAMIATSADGASASSEPRTCGKLATPAEDPSLVLGSRSNATLFSRDTTLIHAERTASVSSTDTARVVASKKVDLCSPEEVEIAGRRSTRVTSSNLVDVRGNQISLLAGGGQANFDGPLPADVSAAVVAEQALHLKSVAGELVACARQDLALHAHDGCIRAVAKQSIEASAGAFSCAAGTVTIRAQQSVRIEAPGAEVTIEAGVVTVKAAVIRLVGDVTIAGSLDVAGGIRGVVQGR